MRVPRFPLSARFVFLFNFFFTSLFFPLRMQKRNTRFCECIERPGDFLHTCSQGFEQLERCRVYSVLHTRRDIYNAHVSYLRMAINSIQACFVNNNCRPGTLPMGIEFSRGFEFIRGPGGCLRKSKGEKVICVIG